MMMNFLIQATIATLDSLPFDFLVCVERFDCWLVTHSHDRHHVQHSPHLVTPTTDKSLAGFFT